MNNYANDNGTGLEQQVIIIWRLPDYNLVLKSVNDFFYSHWKCNEKNQIWQRYL